jgi:CHRD domain/PEP-CTERM motif
MLMKSLYRAVLGASLVLGALTASTTARAAIITFDAILDGPSESPPNASPGTGFAEVDFNTTTNMMHVHVTFSGLTSGTTASHIHSATTIPGAGNAGVATTTPYFAGFPIGVTSGIYDNTFDMTLASSYNPAFVTANGGTPASAEAALLAGMQAEESYLNIHTQNFGGGEIRGFLIPILVPEPSTMALATLGGLGIGATIAAHRRRQRPA